MRRYTRFLVAHLLFALFLLCVFPISLLSQEDARETGSPGWMEHLILNLNEHLGHTVRFLVIRHGHILKPDLGICVL